MKAIKQKLKVGVIGTGYLGKFHAEKYARMDDADLIGVVDIREDQAREIADSLGTKAYSDYHDIMDKVDAVSVVSPTPLHYAISKDFLEHDVDVLIEKPITTNLQEANELIKIAESRNLIIQVGHLERFNPAVVELKKLIKGPMFIESHRLSVYKPRATDVNVVIDLMIHDIDIILNVVGSKIKHLHAAGTPVISGLIDIANARIEFENGCVANVTASRLSTRDERKIRIFQPDAYISVDYANRALTVVRKDEGKEDSPIPDMDIQSRSFPKSDALDDELKAFVQAVKNREKPEVTGHVGRDALGVAIDIIEIIENTHKRFA